MPVESTFGLCETLLIAKDKTSLNIKSYWFGKCRILVESYTAKEDNIAGYLVLENTFEPDPSRKTKRNFVKPDFVIGFSDKGSIEIIIGKLQEIVNEMEK